MYILTRFVSSLLKPCIVKSVVSVSIVVVYSVVCVLEFVDKIKVVRVLLSLLVVLFLRMYSIRPELNFPPAATCSLISDIVQSVGSSS